MNGFDKFILAVLVAWLLIPVVGGLLVGPDVVVGWLIGSLIVFLRPT